MQEVTADRLAGVMRQEKPKAEVPQFTRWVIAARPLPNVPNVLKERGQSRVKSGAIEVQAKRGDGIVFDVADFIRAVGSVEGGVEHSPCHSFVANQFVWQSAVDVDSRAGPRQRFDQGGQRLTRFSLRSMPPENIGTRGGTSRGNVFADELS
jgi:hypothetical protein